MHPDNQHTDKKLQELENLSLPDLSKMDDHWQQMKASLQPVSMPSASKSTTLKKTFRWVAAAMLIAGLSFVAYKYVLHKEQGSQQATDKTTLPTVITIVKDSPVVKLAPAEKISNGDAITLKDPIISDKQGSDKNIVLKGTTTVKKDTLVILNPVPENQPRASLNQFFKELEKGAQRFVINNKRDTLLSGEDGTALLIAANTFESKGEVIITMKEFYSYEDIITNKLTTTSDGRQLVTGGMIHLSASVDGKEVDILPGKSIQWFIPDTSKEMNQMQLFTTNLNQSTVKINQRPLFDTQGDTTTAGGSSDVLNWIPQERGFTNTYLVTRVKVLDMKNEPMKVRSFKRGEVAIFRMAHKPKISREQLKAELKEKYSYHKVKIKKPKKDNFFTRMTPRFLKRSWVRTAEDVGDSAWIPDYIAKQYKLEATDTAVSLQTNYTSNYGSKRTFSKINMNSLAKKFSVDIRTLGWINCDRFYNNNIPKIEYIVDLKDTAINYYTLLVFDNIRSMIQGRAYGNKVFFPGVPEGESAKIISIGIQDGKTVAAMEPVRISRSTLSGLKFEDTSPVAFKEDVKTLDK